MADEFIAHPLITITNVIWSFSRTTRQLQILLIHRADDPYAGYWALPETTLRVRESADAAAIRLIRDKIGVHVNRGSDGAVGHVYGPSPHTWRAGFGADLHDVSADNA